MNRLRWGGALAAAIAGMLTLAPWHAQAAASLQPGCQIQTGHSQIKRMLHLTFDNVHLRRDNPNVPSDLEQMPNLLNFLLQNGVVSGKHHTPLISHTAHDITTVLTGVFPAYSLTARFRPSITRMSSDSGKSRSIRVAGHAPTLSERTSRHGGQCCSQPLA